MTMTSGRRGIVVIALAIAGAAGAAGQDKPATFRSSIDLVRVDVNVLDRNGQPVTGLSAGDFAISVDGRARRVVSTEYVQSIRQGAPRAEAPRQYSTNAGAAPGRLIMIVVDQGTIPPGRGRSVLSAADDFIARLNPSDRVGLVTIPSMQQVDFTSQHHIVRSLLRRIDGLATSLAGVRQIGVSEAIRINRGDPRAIEVAFQRECAGVLSEFERRVCRQQLLMQANAVYTDTRDRARASMVSIRSLAERFAESPDPKTLILVSGGMILDQDFTQLSWFGPLASRGQLTLYSIYVLPPHFEASLGRLPVDYRDDVTLAEEGLGHLADLGRGSVLRLVTDPAPIFKRLELELSGYYVLGFEADASDRDERPHRIKVDVPGRGDLDMRARPEFSAAAERAKTMETVLSETLRAPLLANEIRLKATAYTLRDPASQKLRIVVGAEIDRLRESAGRLALAFTLFDAQGRLVASHLEPDVSTRVNPRTGVHQYFGAVFTDGPGVHTLKVAVADDLKRRGSVEHTFEAKLTTAGALRIGNLLLAENVDADSPAEVEPVVSDDYTGTVLHAIVEIYAEGGAIADTGVTFEIADGERARAISSVTAGPPPPAYVKPTARTFLAALPIDVLPPGEYVARAVVKSSGRTVSQVSRVFRVARPSVTGAASMRTPAFLPSRLDGFDRKGVLAQDVVGFFLDRLTAKDARAGADALSHARTGRFEALPAALAAADANQLSVAFLSGLAMYARNDFDAAASRFRQALKLDSEFFPAAFYLGACYAAVGRNREAANAWRTSLVTESDAPFIYPLIADALLRARDAAGAVAILTEAAGLWPDNEQLQVRLGSAFAIAGRPADALRTLDPYIARHADDHRVIFTALRAIYEARSAGVNIETPERDRDRFARYAAAYAAAAGPQQALVDRWRKFVEGR
jgi:VWFA-related protein